MLAKITAFLNKLNNINFGLGKDRDSFVENLSLLVASGMKITSAIEALGEEARSKAMKRVIAEIREDVENGSPLWKAFVKANVFQDHTISLIRIGEESGKLAPNLKLIAEQEEKDRIFRSRIMSAMMYPLFVLTLTMIVGVIISWFILPKLATVFSQMQMELPALTRGIITGGLFLEKNGIWFFPVFFLCFGLIMYFVFMYSKTKFIGQAVLFHIPGVSQLLREVELARFGYLLGTLLNAGLPITSALESLYSATFLFRYKYLYAHLRDRVEEGNTFRNSFDGFPKSGKLIPTSIQQLIIAGEQSGNLNETLLRISKTYEIKTENTTKNLTVILEPILLVVVWGGVISVALAVILPVYSLIGGINNNSGMESQPAQVKVQ